MDNLYLLVIFGVLFFLSYQCFLIKKKQELIEQCLREILQVINQKNIPEKGMNKEVREKISQKQKENWKKKKASQSDSQDAFIPIP